MNNDTSTVEIRNGTRSDNIGIGRESSHTHKLLCQLRHVGATWDDLVAMRDLDPQVFSEFLARVRGVPLVDGRGELLRIINLDYEPGCFESLVNLSRGSILGAFGAYPPFIADNRLGIWPERLDRGSFVFGNMKFAVEKPYGACVHLLPSRFCSGELGGLSKDCVHLNLAMATWFSQDGRADIPFDGPPFGSSNLGNDSIFFLGTVWWVSAKKTFLAPALTSNKKGDVAFEITSIPIGKWPNNCYVALLVPR